MIIIIIISSSSSSLAIIFLYPRIFNGYPSPDVAVIRSRIVGPSERWGDNRRRGGSSATQCTAESHSFSLYWKVWNVGKWLRCEQFGFSHWIYIAWSIYMVTLC